ncbi:hypothetical protein FT663_00587 [Candidozyma haemuli var. vulneris]|nr:hypothetical protein FT662_00693 [[Candida] haemuloni var. vulneris]KAF3995369.1 hypothetical protein FT663_00587 [[Candida] haemuloni var. vulneris]
MSGSVKSPQKRITSYQYYFKKVYEKRLRYWNKISFLLAIAASAILAFPYISIWWNIVYTITFRAPLIYLALYFVKLCRNFNSTVEYSSNKTLAQQIARSVFTRRYVTSLLFYLGSSYVIYALFMLQLPLRSQYSIVAKEFRKRPAINDEWVYFWFHAYFVALLYTVQHIVFQRNRLQFRYGINHIKPDSVLFSKLPALLGHASLFNTVSSISSPIIYWVIRSIIYKINWLFFAMLSLDSTIPRFHIGFWTLINISFVSFFVFLLWEIVNHVYDTYATIGCLDGKKPISNYSPDPISSILSCLRDVDAENQISRLTAFQELAYLATTNDPEGAKRRKAIYSAHSVAGFVWPAILDECALVIKETSSRVNYRSQSDMKALRGSQPPSKPEEPLNETKDSFLFGNSFNTSTADTTQPMVDASSSPLRRYEDVAPSSSSLYTRLQNNALGRHIINHLVIPTQKFLAAYLNPQTSKSRSKTVTDKLALIQQYYAKYRNELLESSIGVFFRITLKRDTESRVVNPVNYGNAVIALSGILIHAVEEDRNNTVTGAHISEVLNLLERPIRACANYTDMLPASVYLTKEQRENEQATKRHLVALLHDLTIQEFFQLCVKYNHKLNDLSLSSRAFKLAKWVIDASIAQQQKEKESSDLYY